MKDEKQANTESRGVIPPPSVLPILLPILAIVVVFGIFVTPCVIPGRARELAKRSVCGSNMKNIGTAMVMYSTGNRGVCPPNVEAIVIAGQSPDLFICPSSGTEGLEDMGFDPESNTLNPDLDGHCDYVYIAIGDSVYAQGGLVTLFELPMNHQQKAVNIGHLDSHVERHDDLAAMLAKIQASNDYLAERRRL